MLFKTEWHAISRAEKASNPNKQARLNRSFINIYGDTCFTGINKKNYFEKIQETVDR